MSEVMAALTPEEWAEGRFTSEDLAIGRARVGIDLRPRLHVEVKAAPLDTATDLHALAALALHGQPFGFTWADVSLLRDLAEERHFAAAAGGSRAASEIGTEIDGLGDRIAALLPPREGP